MMKTVNLEEIYNKLISERSEIERKNESLLVIKQKLSDIDEGKKKLSQWDKSIQGATSVEDKATFTQARFDENQRIERLEYEVEELYKSTFQTESTSKDTDLVNETGKYVESETKSHIKWLWTNFGIYLGFALGSLLLFLLIHGSQFLITEINPETKQPNPIEWKDLLTTFRYTHQIFLKVSMGFFGILMIGLSINLLNRAVLWYYNDKVNKFSFLSDFLKAEPYQRLYVASFVLYALLEYWGKVMSWQVML